MAVRWTNVRSALAATLTALTCAWATTLGAQDLTFVRIATGATGGTYFPVGGLIASAISNPPGSRECALGGSCGVPGLIAAVVATEGSVENVVAVAGGRMELALTQADVAYFAYHGRGQFALGEPLENLRAIANLFPEAVQLIVRRGGGIETVADLEGQRVSLGEHQSGTLVVARSVLDAFDLEEADLKQDYDKVGKAGDKLALGELDAFFVVGGVPTEGVTYTAEGTDIALVHIKGPEVDDLRKSYPFYGAEIIPAGTYPGVDATVTLKVGTQLVVSASMDEETAYGITRALWHENNRKLLDSGHPNGKQMERHKALDGIAIPLHPGAKRFYDEIGLAPAEEGG